ncbi:potassium channel subfamily K member 1-like [Mytilus galloprovincialis]|uniref:potassium channel subfamily K member 1-like n=1 Tax=Mytilus galloprovincialis TaxID=29158 RepID=UPI003F7B7838
MSLSLRKSTVRLLALSGFYLLYIVIGASVFSAIEGPRERDLTVHVRDVRKKFLKDHSKCLTDGDLEKFLIEINNAAHKGVSSTKNVTMAEPNWSFGQSIFFSVTVLTTIGYGRVTPLSDEGKGFIIVYTVIGIPLTLILFSAIVERLMIPTKVFLYFLFRKLGHLYKVFHIQLLHLFFVILVLLVFIFLIPAAVYSTLEPTWNYLDAFYYCFISMTTIGLGDYIPGDNPEQELRPLYKVATTCYLVIGLWAMMLLMSVLYDIPELNIGFHFYMKSDKDEDEERTALKSSIEKTGTKYTKHVDEEQPTAVQAETSERNTEQ